MVEFAFVKIRDKSTGKKTSYTRMFRETGSAESFVSGNFSNVPHLDVLKKKILTGIPAIEHYLKLKRQQEFRKQGYDKETRQRLNNYMNRLNKK